jgi:hypothetical protein
LLCHGVSALKLPEGKRKRHPSREISLRAMCVASPTMLGFLFGEGIGIAINGEFARSKLLFGILSLLRSRDTLASLGQVDMGWNLKAST